MGSFRVILHIMWGPGLRDTPVGGASAVLAPCRSCSRHCGAEQLLVILDTVCSFKTFSLIGSFANLWALQVDLSTVTSGHLEV